MKFQEIAKELDVVFAGEVLPLDEALENALKVAVAGCIKSNKAASLTLNIKIASKNGMAAITAEIANKDPKPDPLPEMFYIDRKGELSIEDPKQRKFEDIDSDSKKIVPITKEA